MTVNNRQSASIDEKEPLPPAAGGAPSILYLVPSLNVADNREPECFSDLLLDQVFSTITKERDDYQLLSFFHDHLGTADEIRFRHEVWHDLEDAALIHGISEFASEMHDVHQRLSWSRKSSFIQHRRALHLDAANRYCSAVKNLTNTLKDTDLRSRALLRYRESLDAYASSLTFERLATEASSLKDQLSQIRYCINLKGLHVRVVKYEGEADYGAEIEEAFERFQQSAVKDYRRSISDWPDMNHVEAMIADRVALLYGDVFSSLQSFCEHEDVFLDDTVTLFEREVQFYLSYLNFIAPLKAQGLAFCLPDIQATSKEVSAKEAFDVALASKLAREGVAAVCNDFHLEGEERILMVSGPNQGGKTTFARTFGQIHYLASIGCPVPGQAAQLYLYDELFTHFGKEEDPTYRSGKLEDDLLRIRDVLNRATTSSIIIMNEIFASTTAEDALALGTRVIDKIISLDALCVMVTFIDELSVLSPSIVSMTSSINPENPVERTFKIVRHPADGLAYALAIAEKYGLTYDTLRKRITS